MRAIDVACTPAVIATGLTDRLFRRDTGWGYKVWWLEPA
jgi:hypothetical protein